MKKKKPQGYAAGERVHGLRAGLALIEKRREDVLRIGCSKDALTWVEALLGSHADAMSITIFSDHELERIARSPQHEGLCVESKPRHWASAQDVITVLKKTMAGTLTSEVPEDASADEDNNSRGAGFAIALDRVRNSYNIGAILRSAAFFGVNAVILGAPAPHPGLDPNAIRVAEGGAEHLMISRTTDLAETLARLRANGVKVLGADGNADNAIDVVGGGARDDQSNQVLLRTRPALLVLGNEREGLGPRIRAQCDAFVAIRGTGAIESLNVGIAAGILIARLAEASRARAAPPLST